MTGNGQLHMSEAARWDARLRSPECTDVDRADFADWIAADRRNHDAWLRLSILLEAFAAPRVLQPARRMSFGTWHRGGLAAAAVAALLLLVGAAIYLYNPSGPEIVYRAPDAQMRTVELADGSRLKLAPGSEVRVRFRTRQREATLVSGNARFALAAGNGRPFILSAGDRKVTAYKTDFDVGLGRERVLITLLSGAARVQCWHGLLPKVVKLSAGQRITAELGTDSARIEPVRDASRTII